MSAKDMMLGIAEAGVAFKSDLGLYGLASYQSTMKGLAKALSSPDPAVAIANLAEAEAAQLWNMAQPYIRDVLNDVLSEIGTQLGSTISGAVSGAAQSMGSIIPMIGGVIEWYSGYAAAVAAAKREANDEFIRAAANQFKTPQKSGLQLVPADLFHPMPDRADEILDDELEDVLLTPFSTGWILAITTEGSTREFQLPIPPLGFQPGTQLYKHAGRLQIRTIPIAKRNLLRKLRKAIAAARNQPGDGGAAAWPVYLDLIAAEVSAGRLTEETAWRGYRRFVGDLPQVDEDTVAAEGIGKTTVSLATVWSAPFETVYRETGLLYAWYLANHPVYAQDIAYVDAVKASLPRRHS